MNKLKTFLMMVFAALGINVSHVVTAYADEPFIGEIRQFPYTFCPRNWVEANGQLLPISQFTAVFSILGTNFGGDGRTSFGVPNLQNRVVKGEGNGPGLTPVRIGQSGGANTASISAAQMPAHNHTAQTQSQLNISTQDGISPSPANAILADDGRDRVYNQSEPDAALSGEAVVSATTLQSTGNGASFNRQQPFIAMRYCVALNGIYPPRS